MSPVFHRVLMVCLLALLLPACGQDTAAVTESMPQTPTTDTTPANAHIADEPALDPGTTSMRAEQSATNQTAATSPVEAATAATSPVPGLILGQDYEIIEGGQRFSQDGQVEVAEVFAYWCGGCAHFDPLLAGWKKRLSAAVNFVYVPMVSHPQDNYPRAYYAAEAVGILEQAHPELYRAIHVTRRLRPNASQDDIVNFLANYGASANEIKSTMESFAVTASLGRARQFAERNRVPHTPNLIINGTWRVNGKNQEDQLRIADQLIAHALHNPR